MSNFDVSDAFGNVEADRCSSMFSDLARDAAEPTLLRRFSRLKGPRVQKSGEPPHSNESGGRGSNPKEDMDCETEIGLEDPSLLLKTFQAHVQLGSEASETETVKKLLKALFREKNDPQRGRIFSNFSMGHLGAVAMRGVALLDCRIQFGGDKSEAYVKAYDIVSRRHVVELESTCVITSIPNFQGRLWSVDNDNAAKQRVWFDFNASTDKQLGIIETPSVRASPSSEKPGWYSGGIVHVKFRNQPQGALILSFDGRTERQGRFFLALHESGLIEWFKPDFAEIECVTSESVRIVRPAAKRGNAQNASHEISLPDSTDAAQDQLKRRLDVIDKTMGVDNDLGTWKRLFQPANVPKIAARKGFVSAKAKRSLVAAMMPRALTKRRRRSSSDQEYINVDIAREDEPVIVPSPAVSKTRIRLKKNPKTLPGRHKILSNSDAGNGGFVVEESSGKDVYVSPPGVKRDVDKIVAAFRKKYPSDASGNQEYVGNTITNRSFFRGVSSSGNDGKWQARIRAGGKIHYLGRYESEEDAALAYDEAAIMCHGVAAITNFGRAGVHANATNPPEATGRITETVKMAAVALLLQEFSHATSFRVDNTHILTLFNYPEEIVYRGYRINAGSSGAAMGSPDALVALSTVDLTKETLPVGTIEDCIFELRKRLKQGATARRARRITEHPNMENRRHWQKAIRANAARRRISAKMPKNTHRREQRGPAELSRFKDEDDAVETIKFSI